MVRTKEAKTVSLILVVIVLVLACVVPSGLNFGLAPGGSLAGRLAYPFLHANILHAALNCWCLLSLVFLYDLGLWYLVLGYLAAVSVPALLVPGLTLGLSGVCFFLIGRCAFLVTRRLYYNFWAVAFMVLGFAFPNCAAWLHVYCYALGFLVGWLNSPVRG